MGSRSNQLYEPYNLLIGKYDYDVKDKDKGLRLHIMQMLNRSHSMFKYKNLPETVNERMLELYLQINGYCGFIKHTDGNYYVVDGSLGGIEDEYHQPSQMIVVNNALGISGKTYDIGKDIYLIKNDSFNLGLLPIYSKYGKALVENELSMWVMDILSRIPEWVTASDDATKLSAEQYINRIVKGDLSVVATNEFFEGIKVLSSGGTRHQSLTNLIELEQYLKASEFNEIGLNANYNMKRESINSGESQLNNDMLMPLVDELLNCRKEAFDLINKNENLNIEVELASAWEDNEEQIEAEINEMEKGVKNVEDEQIE